MAKKLLNEATIRRFQSLANISPINEMSYKEEKEEEKMEETVKAVEETIEEGEESLEEGAYMEKDEDPADDEMGDLDMGEGMDVDLTDEEARVLIELGEKLAAAMGDEEEMEMGDEPAEMDAEEAPMMEEDELMETLSEIDYVPSQAEIVNEVARRVARRLAEAQKAEKRMNEALGRK